MTAQHTRFADQGPNFAAVCGWPQFPVLMRTTLAHLSTAAAPGRCTCATPALVADPLCQRESSTISPLIAQRRSTGSAASNSPATHRWSAGSHLTPPR